MKKIVLYILASIFIVSCSESKKELFKETDAFVNSLNTSVESYGLLRGEEYATKTSDGLYTIMPVGRLINVKIEKAVGADEYEELKSDIENHYKDDKRVNQVYINNAGTIMIDCRD
jgi:hypothetical protein